MTQPLQDVRRLVEQYAADPLGEGVDAMKKLKELYDSPSSGVQQLFDENKFNTMFRDVPHLNDVAISMSQEIARPLPAPTPDLTPSSPESHDASRQHSHLPTPKPTPDSLVMWRNASGMSDEEVSELENDQTQYNQKLNDMRGQYQENKGDNDYRKRFDATLTTATKQGAMTASTQKDIQDWLVGAGRQNFLGATKLGPTWNALGAVKLGDIAGDIDANLTDRNLKDERFEDALGKVTKDLDDIRQLSNQVTNRLEPYQQSMATVNNAITPTPSTAPRPSPLDPDG